MGPGAEQGDQHEPRGEMKASRAGNTEHECRDTSDIALHEHERIAELSKVFS